MCGWETYFTSILFICFFTIRTLIQAPFKYLAIRRKAILIKRIKFEQFDPMLRIFSRGTIIKHFNRHLFNDSQPHNQIKHKMRKAILRPLSQVWHNIVSFTLSSLRLLFALRYRFFFPGKWSKNKWRLKKTNTFKIYTQCLYCTEHFCDFLRACLRAVSNLIDPALI